MQEEKRKPWDWEQWIAFCFYFVLSLMAWAGSDWNTAIFCVVVLPYVFVGVIRLILDNTLGEKSSPVRNTLQETKQAVVATSKTPLPAPDPPVAKNLTSTNTTVPKIVPPGNHEVAKIVNKSCVGYGNDGLDMYQKQLDDFLKHGVIPGVEATTESCKKTWGMMYELFIGMELEREGYKVRYNGIEEGVKDCGIDIIAEKDLDEIIILQCKYWKNVVVDCDVISRMCGARELFYHLYGRGDIKIGLDCIIVTSSQLTPCAKEFAKDQMINFIEDKNMDLHSVPWVKGYRNRYYLPWDSNYIKIPQEKYFFTVHEASQNGYHTRGNEKDVFEPELSFSICDFCEYSFETLCEKFCCQIETELRKAILPNELLDDIAVTLKYDPFDTLCRQLRKNSLDELKCDECWIELLNAECVKCLRRVSDKECVFFTKVCEQREPEILPEEILLKKFLEYCKRKYYHLAPDVVDADIYDAAFESLSAKCSRYIASRLRHSNLPADTLGCFADDYNLNPFDALCVFLREDYLDSIFGGNLWIDYLRGECEKFCEQCNNEQKKILQIYEELHQEECEDALLDNFLTYCTNYENQRINNAYYQE